MTDEQRRLLARLIDVLPPPAVPTIAPGNWDDVERQVGTRLPADYKAFCEVYGAGGFSGQLFVMYPFGDGEIQPYFVSEVLSQLEMIRTTRDRDPDCGDLVIWPEPGGVLPWGGTNTGGMPCWNTAALDPDEWTCALLPDEGSWPPELHDCGLVEMLARWQGGEVGPSTVLEEIDDQLFAYFEPEVSLLWMSMQTTYPPTSLLERIEFVQSVFAPVVLRKHLLDGGDGSNNVDFESTDHGHRVLHSCEPDGERIEVGFLAGFEDDVRARLTTIGEASDDFTIREPRGG